MNSSTNLSIKQWAAADQPREKMLEKGIASLSDAELVAILLSTGTKNMSAVELAKLIMAESDNNLHTLGKRSIKDLQKLNGIGQAKAVTIVAALELGRRRKNVDLLKQKIASSKTVFEIFQPMLSDIPHEEFWVLYLSRSNNILAKERISHGGTAGTVVDVKIIMKFALENLSNGIILVHNHPSGNRNPSEQDKKITQKIKQACQVMDVQLLDHVIIGDTDYLSFADDGLF